MLEEVNKDSSRSEFDIMTQGDAPMATYYVDLKKQAKKCCFADEDDTIRSKILQSMSDKKLRREAMMKKYTLAQLLENASNKEEVERQAKAMEKSSTQEVKRVYDQRKMEGKPRKPFKPFKKTEKHDEVL